MWNLTVHKVISDPPSALNVMTPMVSTSGMGILLATNEGSIYGSERGRDFMKDTQQAGRRDGPKYLSAYPSLMLLRAFSSLLRACFLKAPGGPVDRTTCFPSHLYPIKAIWFMQTSFPSLPPNFPLCKWCFPSLLCP